MNSTEAKKIKVIVTGATGMVGEGVLHESLLDPAVGQVVSISRKPCGIKDPKLTELIHDDFFDLSAFRDQLTDWDTCFFCLGVSSVGMKPGDYYIMTYTLTLSVAKILSECSPDLTFCYVSGAHTDSTEQGKSRWARVKGKTENDLQKLPFKMVYNFRPGFIKPTKGLQYAKNIYKYINWLYPIGRALSPGGFCTLKELGLAMLEAVTNGYNTNTIEGSDIIELAKRRIAVPADLR